MLGLSLPAGWPLSIDPVRGEPEWVRVPWKPIYDRYGLAPHQVPGVREPRVGGDRAPWPRLIHRTHLPMLGFNEVSIGSLFNRDDLPDFDPILRRYQRNGVGFIQNRRGTLLSDEQRVGKTPQIVYAHEPDSGVLFIIGPQAAQQPWHEWAARRWGACEEVHEGFLCAICKRVGATLEDRPSFKVLKGRQADQAAFADPPQAFFINFACVPPWSELWMFVKIGTLVVDEAHLAGVQNRRNITVEAIRRFNTVADRCVMASGTPMYSRPSGLWPILDIVTPGAFGKFWSYASRFCDAKPGTHGWTANGSANTDELDKRLSEVMLRRRWTDIQDSLPAITRTVELVEIDDNEREELEDAAQELRRESGNCQTVVGHLERLRKLYAELKTERGLELLLQIVADGHSGLGWTWHRSVAEKLGGALRRRGITVFGPIHGGVDEKERQQILDEAHDHAGHRILVATMGSLGTAINLSWASHQVFVELDWVPPTIAQAEMRPYDGAHPISTTFLVADCTPDRRLSEVLLSKLAMAESLRLQPGVGTVAEALGATFQIDAGRSLDQVAELICASEAS